MDPRTEKAEKLAQAIESRISRERVSLVRGDSSHPFWCSDIIVEALLSVPAPTPSADARAKLEQAREATHALRDAAREGRVIGFRQRDPLVLAIHDIFDAYEALLALPPHEGETPQEPLKALAEQQVDLEHDEMRMLNENRWQLYEGETPQPAAEPSGWRDIVEDHSRALELLRELDQFGSRVREWLHTERTPLPPVAQTPQPPVVQTRPEEPKAAQATEKKATS